MALASIRHLHTHTPWRLGGGCPSSWWPLAQGLVRSRKQTSVRAEILAATSALRFAVRLGHQTRIWSDNAQEVRTLRAALSEPDAIRPSQTDHDLWSILMTVARLVQAGQVTVHKVASHQCKTGQDWVEWWAFTGNDQSDHCAQWSTRATQDLVTKWQQAVTGLDAARVLRNQIHLTIAQVSEAALIRDTPHRSQ